MRTEQNRRTTPSAPTCWQREAPCACLRIEASPHEQQFFPYQHLVTASLSGEDDAETLRLVFSSHDVQIAGRNLRQLLFALQDFAVKWIRPVPPRYQALGNEGEGMIFSIRIIEAQ